MASNYPVFVDTSLFKAILDERDDFYTAGTKIWEELLEKGVLLITTNFVIDETLTLLRIRCGLEKAKKFREKIISSFISLKIVRVTTMDEASAWEWFIKDWSDLSFTDCVSFAVMRRLDLEKVATFDQHFQKAGFKIVK